jgi:hypothetical protein
MILVSIFRDSAGYVDRYAAQVEKLRTSLDERLHCITIEGDSTDSTAQDLRDYGFQVLTVEHGGPRFGSIDNPLRWRQIAVVCNVAWCAALREVNPGEAIIYVESDLVWDAETMVALKARLQTHPAVATMSFHEGTNVFYDIWGHRKNGDWFTPQPPYHPGLDGDLVEIDSAGSCFAVRGDAAHHVEFSLKDCIRGVGRTLRAAGHPLMLDTTLAVYHPKD